MQEKELMHGKVKKFNKEKGYGFIKLEDDRDVFFHYSQLNMEGFKTIEFDFSVFFEIGRASCRERV